MEISKCYYPLWCCLSVSSAAPWRWQKAWDTGYRPFFHLTSVSFRMNCVRVRMNLSGNLTFYSTPFYIFCGDLIFSRAFGILFSSLILYVRVLIFFVSVCYHIRVLIFFVVVWHFLRQFDIICTPFDSFVRNGTPYSDEGPMLETFDYTIRIGSTPTIL